MTASAAPAHVLEGYDELFSSRLLVVTGKGGVGKTTMAASLALAARASGRRTLLVEVEGRQGFSRTFGTQPWDYQEREFRPGLWGMAIDPAESVYEYLEMYYGIRRVQWLMERSNALDFVTTAAPGLRDLLLVGKVYEIESRERSSKAKPTYDTIVLDAPPTGRIVPFLEAPEGVTEIARVGAIRRQAAKVREMLEDPARSQAIIVTLLEEMPVTETVEAVELLRGAGVGVGMVLANMVVPARLDGDEAAALDDLGADGVAALVADVGLELDDDLLTLAMTMADQHLARLELQEEMRARLAEVETPVLELPQLTGATFDEQDLRLLSEHLARLVGEEADRLVPGRGLTTEVRG